MIDLFLKFQMNVFVNAANILPQTSTITELLTLFEDNEFLPNTVHEIGPAGPKLRLRMSSPDNKWNILFLPQRIHIEYVGGPNQTGNEMDEFLTRATEITSKMLQYLDQKSYRLAFIVNLILKEMTKAELESCYNKLFIPLPTYTSNSPFEWNNRSVSRGEISLADNTEAVNILTEIKRSKGQLMLGDELKELDRVHIEYEFNTATENKETRFGVEQLLPFMKIAKGNYDNSIKELEGVIYA